MSHILKISFNQDSNVGLHGFANDHFCLITSDIHSRQKKEIKKVLKVPIYSSNLCGTSLIGAFAAGNNRKILVPQIVLEHERRFLEKNDFPFDILKTDHTALGNNIVANDFACLINPELNELKNDIKEFLGVEKIKSMVVGEIQTIGSLLVLNSKGALLSALASEDDAEFISKFFEVPVTRGTVNLGTPFVRSGIIANSNGFVFGGRTGGPEAVAIDEALGFI